MPNVGQARACWVGLMGPWWDALLRARGPTATVARVSCCEERDVGRHAGKLGLSQDRELTLGRAPEPKSPELVGEPRALDPPERLEELDERDPGHVRCAQKIGRSRARPRRPGGIEKRGNVPGVAAHRCAQGAHREATAREDVAEPGSELVVGWGHDRSSVMVAGSVSLT